MILKKRQIDEINSFDELDKKLDYVHWEVKRQSTFLLAFLCLMVFLGMMAYIFRGVL